MGVRRAIKPYRICTGDCDGERGFRGGKAREETTGFEGTRIGEAIAFHNVMSRMDGKGDDVANIGGYFFLAEFEGWVTNFNRDRFRCCDTDKAQSA